MKKIIGLTIAAVLIISLVVGGTWAYFSDTETITGNVFTAGIIDIEVDTEGTVFATATLDDMKPCQTGYMVVVIRNGVDASGEPIAGPYNEVHVWKHIVDIEEANRDDNGITEPEQDFYTTELGGVAKNDIDRYIHFDMLKATTTDPDDLDLNDLGNTPGTVIIAEADNWLISDNQDDVASTGIPIFPNPDDPYDGTYDFNGVSCYWIYLGTIPANSAMIIIQSFHLDGDVGNWAQSDILTFTEEFFALQTAGEEPAVGGWASLLPDSGTELPGYELP